MTIYPVRRSVRTSLSFVAGVFLIGAAAFGGSLLILRSQTYGAGLLGLSFVALSAIALLLGFAAYGLQWILRIPSVKSSVFAGYVVAGLFIGMAIGGPAALLFVDNNDRLILLLLVAFAVSMALLLGYFHAAMLSNRLEPLLGAADALRLGRFHARVQLEGNDQPAQLAAAFNAMADKLEVVDRKERQLERMRSELHYWIGSDFRTPLAAAQAAVDSLAGGAVDNAETYLRFMRTAQRNIAVLSDLADDLYDIAQLETTVIAPVRRPVDVATLVAETVASLAQAAVDKGVTLTGAAAPGLPALELDAHLIGRALNNLASHALHRTPTGGVVKVNAYPTRQGVLFEVVDCFEGERSADMMQLLALFLDEDDVRRHADGGAPLGVAMAGAIIEAHGGRLRSERVANKGLRVVFSLGPSEPSDVPLSRGM